MIESITFTEDFRTFRKGQTIFFDPRATVIVGDNGAGKSSLLGVIRGHFNVKWTRSDQGFKRDKNPGRISPAIPEGSRLTYLCGAQDNFQGATMFDDEDMDLQISLMRKSSGQTFLGQITHALKKPHPVLILDEPERGFSPSMQIVIGEVIRHYIDTTPDTQFIITTHSPAIMRALGRDVLFLPAGSCIRAEDYVSMSEDFGRKKADQWLAYMRSEAKLDL